MDGKKRQWGGARAGAGRPKSEEGTRPQHQVRAFPDEWEIIKAFTKLARTHPDECRAFIEKYTKE